MKKFLLFLVLAGLGVSIYYFLTSEIPGSASNTVAANLQPNYGGTLVIGIPQDVDTFNPLFTESVFGWEILHLMLLGLADLDAKGLLQAEDDVQVVDRFGTEVAAEGRFRGDLVFVNAQRFFEH